MESSKKTGWTVAQGSQRDVSGKYGILSISVSLKMPEKNVKLRFKYGIYLANNRKIKINPFGLNSTQWLEIVVC